MAFNIIYKSTITAWFTELETKLKLLISKNLTHLIMGSSLISQLNNNSTISWHQYKWRTASQTHDRHSKCQTLQLNETLLASSPGYWRSQYLRLKGEDMKRNHRPCTDSLQTSICVYREKNNLRRRRGLEL